MSIPSISTLLRSGEFLTISAAPNLRPSLSPEIVSPCFTADRTSFPTTYDAAVNNGVVAGDEAAARSLPAASQSYQQINTGDLHSVNGIFTATSTTEDSDCHEEHKSSSPLPPPASPSSSPVKN
nr:hypothetical protein Iba_chr07cCG5830 [Ipomoea batatas]